MARKRSANKRAHTSQEYRIEFDRQELSLISFLIGALGGVNREDGRLVASIIDELHLDQERLPEHVRGNLSGYELHFILDAIETTFSAKKMVPAFVATAFSMEDLFKELMFQAESAALQEGEEEEEGPSVGEETS